MKYLHSGYILFCQGADHEEDGRVDARGLFDLFVLKELPTKMNCTCVIGFGTPYERRQYKGIVTIEDPFDEDDWKNWSKFTAKNGDKNSV